MSIRRQQPYLSAAGQTRAWISLIAREQQILPAELRRIVRTPAALEYEIARLIDHYARREAQRLIHEQEPPPTDGTLESRVIRHYHTQLHAVEAAREAREQEASWAAALAAQQNTRTP